MPTKAKARKFKTNFNLDEFEPVKGQTFKMPSLTVEGETLTIKEILQHYSSGILDDRTIKQSLYDFDHDQEEVFEDYPMNRVMEDLTDIDDAKAIIKDVETRKEAYQNALEKARKKNADSGKPEDAKRQSGAKKEVSEVHEVERQ